MRGRTMLQLIQWAYDLPEHDIVGGPEWLRKRFFDIQARSTFEHLTRPQLKVMLRNLLIERFALDATFESRMRPVYLLTLDRKQGPVGRGIRTLPATCIPRGTAPLVRSFSDQATPSSNTCGVLVASTDGALMFLSGWRATMGELAEVMSRHLDRPVLDRTEFTAEFDFVIDVPPPAVNSPGLGGEIFTAMHEQLGLKFEGGTGEVNVLVIRQIALPTEN